MSLEGVPTPIRRLNAKLFQNYRPGYCAKIRLDDFVLPHAIGAGNAVGCMDVESGVGLLLCGCFGIDTIREQPGADDPPHPVYSQILRQVRQILDASAGRCDPRFQDTLLVVCLFEEGFGKAATIEAILKWAGISDVEVWKQHHLQHEHMGFIVKERGNRAAEIHLLLENPAFTSVWVPEDTHPGRPGFYRMILTGGPNPMGPAIDPVDAPDNSAAGISATEEFPARNDAVESTPASETDAMEDIIKGIDFAGLFDEMPTPCIIL